MILTFNTKDTYACVILGVCVWTQVQSKRHVYILIKSCQIVQLHINHKLWLLVKRPYVKYKRETNSLGVYFLKIPDISQLNGRRILTTLHAQKYMNIKPPHKLHGNIRGGEKTTRVMLIFHIQKIPYSFCQPFMLLYLHIQSL